MTHYIAALVFAFLIVYVGLMISNLVMPKEKIGLLELVVFGGLVTMAVWYIA